VSSWAAAAATGDPWLLLLEVFAVCLQRGTISSSLLPQQVQQSSIATAGDDTAVWLQHPAELLYQLLLLLLPCAVTQAALWAVSQHAQHLPTAALQHQQEQQPLALVLSVLRGVGESLVQQEQRADNSSSSSVLGEAIAAQLLPLLHRVHLLKALLRQQQPDTRLVDSYSRVEAPPATATGPTSSGQRWLPSAQAKLVLTDLGVPASLGLLLQAALDRLVLASAAAAGGADMQPPPWLTQAMVAAAFAAVSAQQGAGGSAAAAAAAAAVSGPSGLLLPRRPSWLPLPERYQDIYLTLSEMKCGLCGKEVEHGGLCLVTGR
jgi:hypothetical protein